MVWDKDVAAAYLKYRVAAELKGKGHGAVKELADRVTAAARRKVLPQTISQLMGERGGTSPQTFDAFAAYWKRSHDQLLEDAYTFWAAEHGDSPPRRTEESRVVRESTIPLFGNLPGWQEALARARKRYPKVSDEAWAGAGRLSAAEFPDNALLDEAVVLSIARHWEDLQNAPRKTEAEVQAEVDADEPLD